MAVDIVLMDGKGREFKLGRFNEGNKSIEKTALAAARKYHNLIGKLQCGDWFMRLQKNPPHDIPIEALKRDI